MSNRIEKYFADHKEEKPKWVKFNKLVAKNLFKEEKCFKCQKVSNVKYAWIIALGVNTSGKNKGNKFISHFLLREHGYCDTCSKLKIVKNQCLTISLPIMFKKSKPKLNKISVQWLSSVDEFVEKSKEHTENEIKKMYGEGDEKIS